MTTNQQNSIKAVLQAALHNAKIVQDQLLSLYNPKDKSFPDWDMRETAKQVDEAVTAIEESLKEIEDVKIQD